MAWGATNTQNHKGAVNLPFRARTNRVVRSREANGRVVLLAFECLANLGARSEGASK